MATQQANPHCKTAGGYHEHRETTQGQSIERRCAQQEVP